MSNHLLHHYENELAFLKKESETFARNHPNVAGKLRLREDELQDPLIEHLISAVAFLNARIQYRLEESFPAFSKAILESLYPHYVRPIPPCSIASFDLAQYNDDVVKIASGASLDTEGYQGKRSSFRTCGPIDLHPINVALAELKFRPCQAPLSDEQKGNAILHLELSANESIASLSELELDSLRFYIGGQGNHRASLYETLLRQANSIVLAEHPTDKNARIISASNMKPAGFHEDEALLPYPKNTLLGYRLLTEFFVMQDKFLFFDISGLQEAFKTIQSRTVHIYIYLENAAEDLEHKINKENFQLGCVPVVNLFKQTTDPIRLNYHDAEYPLEPDVTQHDNLEIYSVDEVHHVDKHGQSMQLSHFFDSRPILEDSHEKLYWFSQRQSVLEGDSRKEAASSLSLSFINRDFHSSASTEAVVTADTTCFNRNNVNKLPFSTGIFLSASDGQIPAIPIQLTIAPTPVLRFEDKPDHYWKLISHLNLNHLSLDNSETALRTLKTILKLYDVRGTAVTGSLIDALIDIDVTPISATIRIGKTYAPARGLNICLVFDELGLGEQSPFLFASVLEHFFGLYCTINSFTRTSYRFRGQETVEHTWPPRNGEQALI